MHSCAQEPKTTFHSTIQTANSKQMGFIRIHSLNASTSPFLLLDFQLNRKNPNPIFKMSTLNSAPLRSFLLILWAVEVTAVPARSPRATDVSDALLFANSFAHPRFATPRSSEILSKQTKDQTRPFTPFARRTRIIFSLTRDRKIPRYAKSLRDIYKRPPNPNADSRKKATFSKNSVTSK